MFNEVGISKLDYVKESRYRKIIMLGLKGMSMGGSRGLLMEGGASMYIVKSGAGYFVRFDRDNPVMDCRPSRVQMFYLLSAKRIVKRLEELGFAGDLIELRFAKT